MLWVVGMGMFIRERQRNGNRGVFADGGLGASCMDCTRVETLRGGECLVVSIAGA